MNTYRLFTEFASGDRWVGGTVNASGCWGCRGREETSNKTCEQNTVCGPIDIKLCMCLRGRAHQFGDRKIGLSTIDC